MMLNVVEATKGQIAKIDEKYIPTTFKKVKVVYNDTFFITVECLTYSYEYQVSRDGEPCFVGLRRGQSRYDINYPEKDSKLYIALKGIADQYIKEWDEGNLL